MITIEDQPYTLTAVGQPLIIVASSNNVGNTGFRYKVQIEVADIDENLLTTVVYIPPNPADKLIFDMSPIMTQYVQVPVVYADGSIIPTQSENKIYDNILAYYANPQFNVSIKEAWLVDGVLTDNDASEVGFIQRTFGARIPLSLGYKPSIETLYGLTGNTKRFLSARTPTTHIPDNFPQIAGLGDVIYIPVREADYGTLCFVMDGGDPVSGYTGAKKFRITLVPESGSPATFIWDSPIECRIVNASVFPANLNANVSGMPKPSDYPNWKYIAVQALDNSNNIVSASYVLYNAALYGGTNCKYDNVRLGWVNEHGGWDYQNFSMKNEEAIEIERRRYRKVVGTYAAETFGFNSFDRGLTERTPIVSRFLNIDSGWLQEGEFVFLKSLLQSSSVYIINDDATVTPVVVEDTSYLVRKARDKKQYNQSLKLRYSHNVNV